MHGNQDRPTFKLLADPIKNNLIQQGFNELNAGMLAGVLVEAQMDALWNQGYHVEVRKNEDNEDNQSTPEDN